MRVEVRFFAFYREQAGQDRLSLILPEGARVKDLVEALKGLVPALALEGGMAAVNQSLAGPETPLKEGNGVAFLPPGFRGAVVLEEENLGLTRAPLDLEALVDWAIRPEYGAVVSFLGTTRSPNRGEEVAFLEYESYEEIALKTLKALVEEMRARFAIGRVAIWHRLGRVEPKEASIAIVVSAPTERRPFWRWSTR